MTRSTEANDTRLSESRVPSPDRLAGAGAPVPPLDHYWLPFTANRAFRAAPRLLVRARDMHYEDADGRRVLDMTAGLWCVNAGHCREPIVRAIAEQAATLDYATAFQIGHPAEFALASRLAELLPPGLDRVFFTNSGSEAVDTALKIALAYHRARGETERVLLVGRERGYHGVGFGGISVGGIPANRTQSGPHTLQHVAHLPHTHDPARNAFSRGLPPHGALEAVIAEHGAERIAAVIVEPVAGSTGVLVPPAGYLERLRAICDRHQLLLIFDEVITGFGRVGTAFAAQRFGVTPDLLTTAKGLTNGAVPMGAVAVRRDIHQTILERSTTPIELFHGYTYSGHPLACAAGLATLDLYRDERLFARSAATEPAFETMLHSLRGLPHVIDVRNIGLMGAFELAPRDGAVGARGSEAFVRCFEAGLLVRVTGDVIAMSPPFIVEQTHLDEAADILGRVLSSVA
jgi:beta-alanine--pyruvate transaminase